MRYISTKVAVTKTSSLGDDCLLVDLDGPGGAPSNTIRFAVSPEVAHKIGDAAGPRPVDVTVDVIAMKESSGKITYFAQMYRPGTDRLMDGISIYSSTSKGRVQHLVDEYKHIFGQGPKPEFRDYDFNIPPDQERFEYANLKYNIDRGIQEFLKTGSLDKAGWNEEMRDAILKEIVSEQRCSQCASSGITESIKSEVVPYGTEDKAVTVYVPVMTCPKCEFSYTDDRAEGIRDAAVRAATGGGTTLDAIAFWYESTIMGPVFGTPSAQDLHKKRRHAASMEFARRLVEAFPAVLGKASA